MDLTISRVAKESATRMVLSIVPAAKLFIKPPKNSSSIAGEIKQIKVYRLNAAIVRSSKHIENSIWAEKLAGGSADLKNTLGWGGLASGEEPIVPPGSTWQRELRPSKEPGALRTLDSVLGQVRERTVLKSNNINLNFRVKGSPALAGQTLQRLRKQATSWKMR